LVGQAIQGNLDLRQAEWRIVQARANRGVVVAGLWPQVNVTGDYRRSGAGSKVAGGSTGGSHDLYQAGLDAAWELDVFGGVRRNVEAAEANIQAAIEDRRDVLITLISEVALNYLDLRGFQRQIAIAKENLEAQQRTADLTRRRRAAGFASRLDVANAEAQVATTLSTIPLFESSARQAIFNLSLLVGREPGALLAELSTSAAIPPIPPEVPVGLPSELLRRRPDIRRAEAQLHIATANIGVATADLFPKFSLTGSLTLQGNNLAALTNWGNRVWSVGPNVTWPLFDAGRIRWNIRVQGAIQEQSLLAYQSAVLTALRDVEVALVAYVQEQQHRQALADAVTSNREAVDVATLLYTQGQTDFLNVLSAQRSLFAAEDALVQSDRALATDVVAIYKALGGGWENPFPGATLAQTSAMGAGATTRAVGE
jgi:NodT family efflux transporter outer membrane factor (OMF) lipoprotein